MCFNPSDGGNKINSVIIVLFNSGSNCENIGIKNDIVCRKTRLLCQQVVGALANGYPSVKSRRLPSLIKCHDNNGSTHFTGYSCLLQKHFLALFKGDRIDNGFALQAFQSFQYDLPFA